MLAGRDNQEAGRGATALHPLSTAFPPQAVAVVVPTPRQVVLAAQAEADLRLPPRGRTLPGAQAPAGRATAAAQVSETPRSSSEQQVAAAAPALLAGLPHQAQVVRVALAFRPISQGPLCFMRAAAVAQASPQGQAGLAALAAAALAALASLPAAFLARRTRAGAEAGPKAILAA